VWGETLPALPKGPLLLTGMTPEQLSPDYWINRLPNPDQAIKTPEELELFNREIDAMVAERVDLFALERERGGRSVRDQLRLEFDTVRGRILFDVEGKRIRQDLFSGEIGPNMGFDLVSARIRLKWGVATQATSIRALPTQVKMLEEVGDIEFDQLQFSLIKLWTPVAILHESRDGAWFYVQAPYVRGWVRAKDIALFSSRDELKQWASSKKILVVTGESIAIYLDAALTDSSLRASMGTTLPLIAQSESAYEIRIPTRKADGSVLIGPAYVDLKSDVSIGYPAFTQRNVIRQAFKLLGARYGWGGMYDGRDCSGFTHDVYLSLGVQIPRDSKQQGLVGTQLGHFEPGEYEREKINALRTGMPGNTLLRMPLHMMLYLGEIDGRFFVVHSTWAERVSMTSDEKNRINQVVVSDLSLNGKSYLGSLFDRIVSINELN